MDILEATKNFLFERKLSYRRVFNLDNKDAVSVLEDLAKFCRANESAFHEDPRLHAVFEGRREVWLRIQQHLKLREEDLWKLYVPRK